MLFFVSSFYLCERLQLLLFLRLIAGDLIFCAAFDSLPSKNQVMVAWWAWCLVILFYRLNCHIFAYIFTRIGLKICFRLRDIQGNFFASLKGIMMVFAEWFPFWFVIYVIFAYHFHCRLYGWSHVAIIVLASISSEFVFRFDAWLALAECHRFMWWWVEYSFFLGVVIAYNLVSCRLERSHMKNSLWLTGILAGVCSLICAF